MYGMSKNGKRLDGRLELRIPSDLKQEIEKAAEKDGRSVNNWILKAIREGLRP